MSIYTAHVKVILEAVVTLTAEDEGEARARFETCPLPYDTNNFQFKRIVGPIIKQTPPPAEIKFVIIDDKEDK
jgi:hypothetical protein